MRSAGTSGGPSKKKKHPLPARSNAASSLEESRQRYKVSTFGSSGLRTNSGLCRGLKSLQYVANCHTEACWCLSVSVKWVLIISGKDRSHLWCNSITWTKPESAWTRLTGTYLSKVWMAIWNIATENWEFLWCQFSHYGRNPIPWWQFVVPPAMTKLASSL